MGVSRTLQLDRATPKHGHGPFGLLLLQRAGGGLARQQSRRPAAVTISSIERMLSSLPGIGRSTTSGSQSVSISATVAMPSLRASLTAFFSFFGSIDHQALGQAVHRADAVQVADTSCGTRGSAPTASSSSTCRSLRVLRMSSSSSSRPSRLRIVRKLVSVPPSQRSLT